MESSLLATFIVELSSIRSYGEGFKILDRISLISKKLYAENEQLFHNVIQKALGFREPDTSIKSAEIEAHNSGKPPESFFYGFFQYKLSDNIGIYDRCWTYYRVTINHYPEFVITFHSNTDERFVFIGDSYFTNDYFLIYRKGILEIYHLKPLNNPTNKIYSGEFLMSSYMAIQRKWGLLILYEHEKRSYFASLKLVNGKYELEKDIRRYDGDTSMSGYYGVYRNGDPRMPDRFYNKEYFTDVEYPLDPLITSLSGHIYKTKNVYPTIDLILMYEYGGFLYDAKNNNIAWVFFKDKELLMFDSFIISENHIVDIITGKSLLLLEYLPQKSSFLLTRKDNDTGYWIWINTP